MKPFLHLHKGTERISEGHAAEVRQMCAVKDHRRYGIPYRPTPGHHGILDSEIRKHSFCYFRKHRRRGGTSTGAAGRLINHYQNTYLRVIIGSKAYKGRRSPFRVSPLADGLLSCAGFPYHHIKPYPRPGPGPPLHHKAHH